jgi:hypothetical protein
MSGPSVHHWLGFPSVGEMLDGTTRDMLNGWPVRPEIYLLPIADRSMIGTSSLGSTLQYVVLQSITPGGVVNYCKVLTGQLSTVNGNPMREEDGVRINRRTDSLIAAVKRLCRLKDLRIVEASLAMPEGLKYLAGGAAPAVYDPESDSYLLPETAVDDRPEPSPDHALDV